MENQVKTNVDGIATMRVYVKQSTFKGATAEDVWYSATRSDGCSVVCVFKCPVPTKSKAFEIGNIRGGKKEKQVEVKGEVYNNITYFIDSCDFFEIEGEDLTV